MELNERLEYLEKEIERLKDRITELETTQSDKISDRAEVVRASRFLLVDDTGTVRATLGYDEYGTRLTLNDSKGNLRTGVHALGKGSGITLSDETGKIRMKLGVLNNRPEIVLFDSEGNDRMLLAATENFGPHVSLFDRKGKDRMVMVVVEQGPGIVISDADGKTIWAAPESQPRWLSH